MILIIWKLIGLFFFLNKQFPNLNVDLFPVIFVNGTVGLYKFKYFTTRKVYSSEQIDERKMTNIALKGKFVKKNQVLESRRRIIKRKKELRKKLFRISVELISVAI